jgi:hypothetical protein
VVPSIKSARCRSEFLAPAVLLWLAKRASAETSAGDVSAETSAGQVSAETPPEAEYPIRAIDRPEACGGRTRLVARNSISRDSEPTQVGVDFFALCADDR